MKPDSIKFRTLGPLALTLAALFAAFVVGAHRHQRQDIDEATLSGLTAVDNLLQMELSP